MSQRDDLNNVQDSSQMSTAHDDVYSSSSTPEFSEDEGTDLELEDISEGSEHEYISSDEKEMHVQPVGSHVSLETHNNIQLPDETCSALVPLGEDGSDQEIDSEEEQELLRGIKLDIFGRVRAEMQEELDVYKVKLKALEQGTSTTEEVEEDKEPDKEEDPKESADDKLKEAILKMNKLDRILAKKVKKEKEAKRSRLLFEQSMREEICAIQAGHEIQKEIKFNIYKFLALAPPPGHSEGFQDSNDPMEPVFQTQLNETDFEKHERSRENRCHSKASQSTDATLEDNISGGRKRTKKKRKDFIKRNKELAGNADPIAITEDEKKRIGDLLANLDALEDTPEDIDDDDKQLPVNQVMLKAGDGYNPDNLESTSLTTIDNRLRVLLPDEEYESYVTAPPSIIQHKYFTHVDVMSIIDNDRYGERALLETKEERDMQARLKKIEDELASFYCSDEIQIDTPGLSDYQLNTLLDQCVRSLSRSSDPASTGHLTSRSDVSSRASIMENPPHLPDDVLQKLLAEAHFPLSSRLSALEEEDDDAEMEGARKEPILAETWKTIVNEQVPSCDADEEIDDTRFQCPSRTPPRTPSQNSVRPSSILGRPLSNHSYYTSESVDAEDSRLILPDICSSPYLVCQNNQFTKNESNHKRNSNQVHSDTVDIVWNNLNGHSVSRNGDPNDEHTDQNFPRPPKSERPVLSRNSPNSSRTTTPSSPFRTVK